MGEIYSYGRGIRIVCKGKLIEGTLEGISNEGDIRGIDVMDDKGESRFYPISDLEGVEIKTILMNEIEHPFVYIDPKYDLAEGKIK